MQKLTSKYCFYIFTLLLFLVSCSKQKVEIKSDTNRPSTFFDLKTYFEEINDSYYKKAVKVNKQVSFGSSSDYIENMAFDTSEFQIFIQSDINRTAWIDKFTIDTIPKANGYTVLYQTSSGKIPVKKVEIDFNQGKQVAEINILSERQSLLYKSKKTLTFKPDISYKVEGWQRTLMLSKTDFKVEGNLVM